MSEIWGTASIMCVEVEDMPLRIVRNDITKMNTQAIVNTANKFPVVGEGCDRAIYTAAGFDKLLEYRKEHIGEVPEGEVFITPGFDLKAEFIIHAVSPVYINGDSGEDERLRSCYRKSLKLADEREIKSIAFPLISTGGYGYPKEEGMRIAVDEINAFLLDHDLIIYLVVFDEKTTSLGERLYSGLEEYIDQNYVDSRRDEEYGAGFYGSRREESGSLEARIGETNFVGARGGKSNFPGARIGESNFAGARIEEASRPTVSHSNIERPDDKKRGIRNLFGKASNKSVEDKMGSLPPLSAGTILDELAEEGAPEILADEGIPEELAEEGAPEELAEERVPEELANRDSSVGMYASVAMEASYVPFEEEHESKLEERMQHLSDTFSQYLLYLIQDKNMSNADVYKRAIVDKKTFSKIKNNVDYHPQKLTALCLCVGAKLNLDESKDLLARAGYALSPCDKTDIIFSYFIENKIYDMIELDIQLEEHGLPCIIS
ncbi:O-acetyl-ADP-ribose deacetylase (regulator of RNase III), contains Macro domain [Lachnospiraceae bacterium NE2001]|nr:O-acetyl-ADP-ribose deacetylase (regulator of RNase III), contains Macro domain [Lachnospiraceae bacterium NE2001]